MGSPLVRSRYLNSCYWAVWQMVDWFKCFFCVMKKKFLDWKKKYLRKFNFMFKIVSFKSTIICYVFPIFLYLFGKRIFLCVQNSNQLRQSFEPNHFPGTCRRTAVVAGSQIWRIAGMREQFKSQFMHFSILFYWFLTGLLSSSGGAVFHDFLFQINQ